MIEAGTIKVEKGEKKNGWLPVEGDDRQHSGENGGTRYSGENSGIRYFGGTGGMQLPVTVICGEQDGPTVLISAGIHGAEYIGIQTAMELSREICPEEVKGTLIFLLVANSSACHSYTRFVVPEDGQNLNRMFPGRADGTLSERIAWTITNRLQNLADYYVDLHAGDTCEEVMPFVYFNGACAPEVSRVSEEMASATDMAIRARSSATTGAYSSACMRGLPAVLIERGGGGRFTKAEVDAYKRDVRNILIRVSALAGEEIHTRNQQTVNRATYVEAETDGFWYPAFAAGERFEEGDVVGVIRDVWGEMIRTYCAEYDGVVLYQTVGMGVRAGDPLVAYGMVE